MKILILLLLIHIAKAQDGNTTISNSTNGTTYFNATTTTTLRGVTTTMGYDATTTSTYTSTTAPVITTTRRPMATTTSELNVTTTTPVPLCSSDTKNKSCKVCIGPLCKFVERGEQGVGWEILFVAFAMSLIGVTFLGIWYICLRPILHQNKAEDILWITDSSDDEDWQETATLMTNQQIRRKTSRELEIIDLNPVKSNE